MNVKLQQPITGGGLPNTNFFNGRLVTGADMTREQDARRETVSRLGQSVGEGIAEGLKVAIVSNSADNPVVGVSGGRAVSRAGQVLCLSEDATVNLVERMSTIEQATNMFSRCPSAAVSGTYAAGFGLYLLVLSPVVTRQGSAPVGGLKNSLPTCGSDVILEAVQFRLLPIDPFLSDEILPNKNRLRNYIAHRFFGTLETQQFYRNPYGFSLENYGLLEEMRDKTLSKTDVPLAVIDWTANGLEFVEMWAVRRRLTKFNDSENWTQLFGDRRQSENEAMIRQFAEQIEGEKPEINDYRKIAAGDFFYFLPPVGMLPLATGSSKNGFSLESFFGDKVLENIAMIDGDNLQPLLREALRHEPIKLNSDEKIQIYLVRENFAAAQAGEVKQVTAIFAKQTLPYFSTARFDSADWNLSRFV